MINEVDDRRTGPHQHLAAAWVSLALVPVGAVLGYLVGAALAGLIDVDLHNPGTMSSGEKALVFVPLGLIWLTAPTVGVILGVRAWRLGSRSGLVAGVSSAIVWVLVFLLALNNPQG